MRSPEKVFLARIEGGGVRVGSPRFLAGRGIDLARLTAMLASASGAW